jgi:HSP20 family molecular chaperone IbpA
MNAYSFFKELDNLSDGWLTRTSTPKVDVVENKESYELTAELPGFKKDDVTVQIQDGVLQLTANAETKETKDEVQWLLRERRTQTFQRSFRLPRDVDGEAISAEFRDGLLVLTLPKKEESKPKLVAIKAA